MEEKRRGSRLTARLALFGGLDSVLHCIDYEVSKGIRQTLENLAVDGVVVSHDFEAHLFPGAAGHVADELSERCGDVGEGCRSEVHRSGLQVEKRLVCALDEAHESGEFVGDALGRGRMLH